MDNNLLIALGAVGLALVAMLLTLTEAHDPVAELAEVPVYAVATLAELGRYPDLASTPDVPDFVVVRLPQSNLTVVLRPLTQVEVEVSHNRPIAVALIEWQLVGDAVVIPRLNVVDVSKLPPDLVFFLKAKINEISGFPAFGLGG